MKTLLLTSAGTQVKEEILKILPRSASQLKLVHIITASKVKKDTAYMKEDKKDLLEMGFDVEDIDIKGKSEDELRQILKNKDVIQTKI